EYRTWIAPTASTVRLRENTGSAGRVPRDNPHARLRNQTLAVTPHRRLCPAERCELGRSQWCLGHGEELVELRRRNRCRRQHRMRLTAMMDLVLEEMHQQTIASFGLHPCFAIDPHGGLELVNSQRIAMCN